MASSFAVFLGKQLVISSLAVWSLSICCISCLSVLDSWAIMNNDDDDDDDDDTVRTSYV